MNCSLPGSSVHAILQARVLEWVAVSFSRASSQPRDQTRVSCIAGGFLTVLATRKVPVSSWGEVKSCCTGHQDGFLLQVREHLAKWLGKNYSICRVKWGETTSSTICPYRLYLFAIHQLLLYFTSICNVNDHFSLKLHNDAQLKKVIESAKREQMEVFSPICIFIKKIENSTKGDTEVLAPRGYRDLYTIVSCFSATIHSWNLYSFIPAEITENALRGKKKICLSV